MKSGGPSLFLAIVLMALVGCASTRSDVPQQMRLLVGHDGVFQHNAVLVRYQDGSLWAIAAEREPTLTTSNAVIVRIAQGAEFRVLATRVLRDENGSTPYLVCRSLDGQYRYSLDPEDDDLVMIVIPD